MWIKGDKMRLVVIGSCWAEKWRNGEGVGVEQGVERDGWCLLVLNSKIFDLIYQRIVGMGDNSV